MYYYNQNDYESVNYDRSGTTVIETVKSSGCGVCSACMVFNNLIGKELYTVKEMAAFSLKNGARDSSGTNMKTLLTALCKANPTFSFTTTSDEDKLITHIKNGGMAIANQGDAYNVFSTAGHFVVAYRMSGNNIEILDPQMYSGKYDAYSRPERIVKKTENGCIVSKAEINKATQDRSPAYFLVSYKKPEPKAPTIKTGTYTLTNVRGVYKGYGAKTGRKKVSALTADGKKNATSTKSTADAYLKAGTKVTILETKLLDTGNLWAKIPSGYICIWERNIDKTFVK
ncbi:MAG: C39 family peptidase [Eubacterium sp.]